MSELTTKNIIYSETISNDAKIICHDGNTVVETPMSNIKELTALILPAIATEHCKIFSDNGANENAYTAGAYYIVKDSEFDALKNGRKVIYVKNTTYGYVNSAIFSYFKCAPISSNNNLIVDAIQFFTLPTTATKLTSVSFSGYYSPIISASTLKTMCLDSSMSSMGAPGQGDLIIQLLEDNGYFDLDEE